jgi:hypothetical protein
MKVIKGVLKEELSNSLAMKRNFQRELVKLPKGSLVKKKIRGHIYYYVVLREKGRVRFIYKGKLATEDVKKYKQTQEFKIKYRKSISELNKQIKFLKGTLRGKRTA